MERSNGEGRGEDRTEGKGSVVESKKILTLKRTPLEGPKVRVTWSQSRLLSQNHATR